jgi:glyoxylate/hydroxypyruvate reductase A
VKLLFYTAASNSAAWLDALSRAMPRASIGTWPEGAAGATDGADYALVWKPPPELLAKLGSAKAIFNLGAGVDNLDPIPRSLQAVPLIRLEDAGMAEQMAEYVVHAVLRRYREFDAYAQSQRDTLWQPRDRVDKSGFRIGMLGMGVLGAAVAAALAPFGFPVDGWSRSRKQISDVRSFAGTAELGEFLGRCRVLVCLLPLTAETRGMLNRAMLSQLSHGAYVVNVSRGALLVDEDLLALIESGAIDGATLDVFQEEPLPPSHAFWHHPRITVTPHVSALTRIEESVAQIAAKIRRLEAGLPVSGVVDRARFY